MMYGFGDAERPRLSTTKLVQELVIEFIETIVKKAKDLAPVNGRVTTDHLLFVIRKDAKKYNRAVELLAMDEEVREAKSVLSNKQNIK